MRCAARPVGAASAIWSGRSVPEESNARRMAQTIVVLPVPGPPVITTKRLEAARSTAARWYSSRSNVKRMAPLRNAGATGATSAEPAAPSRRPPSSALTASTSRHWRWKASVPGPNESTTGSCAKSPRCGAAKASHAERAASAAAALAASSSSGDQAARARSSGAAAVRRKELPPCRARQSAATSSAWPAWALSSGRRFARSRASWRSANRMAFVESIRARTARTSRSPSLPEEGMPAAASRAESVSIEGVGMGRAGLWMGRGLQGRVRRRHSTARRAAAAFSRKRSRQPGAKRSRKTAGPAPCSPPRTNR